MKLCEKQRPEVLQGAGAGADCAVLDTADYPAVSCSVHPAVIDQMIKVRYSLEHAVNNLACSGCLPVFALLTILLPPEAQECALREIMACAAGVCGEYHLEICGGHTEVSPAVSRPVLCVTVIGAAASVPGGREAQAAGKESGGFLRISRLEPDQDLLVAGFIAEEGTALLAREREAELCARFSQVFVEQAKSMGESICVLHAAQAALKLGAAALHDVSQGGIFGALWEMCEGGKVGLEADLRRIPIRQESVEVCELFGLNPYCLLSGGALLIAAGDGKRMAEELQKEGIAAVVIGRTTAGNDRILRNGEERRFLEKPAQDEFYRRDGVWQ